MGTYAYDATNDTLDLIAGRGNTDALSAKLSKTSDNIAPKQDTNTASELIPVGKYFINANGDLCQCDVQIASGGSIITGTNCHVISDGIGNELNSKIPTLDYHIGDQIGYSVPSANTWVKVGTFNPTPLREYRIGSTYAYAELRGLGISENINATSPYQYIESSRDLSNLTMPFMTKYANTPISLFAKYSGASSGELFTVYTR